MRRVLATVLAAVALIVLERIFIRVFYGLFYKGPETLFYPWPHIITGMAIDVGFIIAAVAIGKHLVGRWLKPR